MNEKRKFKGFNGEKMKVQIYNCSGHSHLFIYDSNGKELCDMHLSDKRLSIFVKERVLFYHWKDGKLEVKSGG